MESPSSTGTALSLEVCRLAASPLRSHPQTSPWNRFQAIFFQHLLYPWYTLWILVNYLSRFLGKVWSKQVKNLTVGILLDIIIVYVPPKSCVTNIILQCSIIWDAAWWEVSWAWRKVLMNGVMSFLQEFGPLFSLFCVYSLPFHFVQWVEAVWGPPPEAEHCSWTSRLQNHEWKQIWFINRMALGILLQQQKMDKATQVHKHYLFRELNWLQGLSY